MDTPQDKSEEGARTGPKPRGMQSRKDRMAGTYDLHCHVPIQDMDQLRDLLPALDYPSDSARIRYAVRKLLEAHGLKPSRPRMIG